MTSLTSLVRRRPGLPARAAALLPVLFVATACGGLGEAMSAHTDVVARAAGKELRVDETAQILAMNPQIPPDSEVVRALANLWVDYALLANAVAEDTTLAALDIAALTGPIREQALVALLRDAVVQADTLFDEAELERRWATDGPGLEIRARHILLRALAEGTPAQRDSVREFAESLRARAAAGEPFDQLAAQHSEDPGSAARGGDLGFFSRGRMVQPFEDAAFELQPGEVSAVVETPFGYHVIMMEERRQPALADQREEFRQFLVQRSIEEAEIEFVEGLTEAANVQIRPGSLAVVREIGSRPEISLRGRAADRAIATYQGGEYTAGEFATFIRSQPPQVQSAFATATDDQLEAGVEQLVQMELLLAEAARRGIALTADEEEEIRAEARVAIRELVEATGFAEAARLGADPAALDAHVKMLVEGIVTGEQPFVPLGSLGLGLRDLYPYEVNEGSFAQVVARLEEIRARQPAPDAGLPIDPGLGAPGTQGLPQDQAPAAPPANPTAPGDGGN